jgi:hypothetical protein
MRGETLLQRKKFFRDGINTNKNIPSESSVTSGEMTSRKRRFTRHKEIEQHMPLLTMLRNSVENKLPLYQPFMIKKFVEI